MRKILILANDETTIFNFRLELLSSLAVECFKLLVSFPRGQKDLKTLTDIGCEFVDVQMQRKGKNPFSDFKLIIDYIKMLKRFKPDVVLTYTAKPNIYGGIACRISRTPYLSNITGLGVMTDRGFTQRLMLTMQRVALKSSFCVFFQNDYNLSFYRKTGVITDNAELLPGSGVNLTLHRQEEYPPEGKTIRFITVSRLLRDKGYTELFDAIKALSPKHDNLEFHIVGWYEEDDYKKLVNELSAKHMIVYHGSQPQERVHELIKEADCLIHPSYHEGMSNVILEAAACGRPCLCSDIPGCREIVDDGSGGFTFEPKSSEGIAEAVERFAALDYQTRRSMGEAARAKVEREFDRNIVIDAYLNKIYEIVGKG